MTESTRRPVDPWNESTITSAEEVQVRQLAGLLELRAQADDQVAVRHAYLDALGIGPGERVLDVGCGTGAVTREVARRVGPGGYVVGLDPSPSMLTVARELAEHEGVHEQIEFRVGNARDLPFAAGSFDVLVAVTALSHASDAEQAIPGLIRAVRPGGRVGIFDLDTASWVISHPDRELTRRIGVAGSSIATDGWLARRLPGLLQAAGLQDVRVRAFTPLEQDPAGFYAKLAERWAEAAVEVQAISEGEFRTWLAALHAEQAAKRYFAGITHLFVWGSRPVS
jgi:ubiquinone/menaquinone biosynthesis C-methylase UbiE